MSIWPPDTELCSVSLSEIRLCLVPECFFDRTNPLEVLTEEEVFARYMFRSQTILYLVDLCDDVRRRTNRSFAVPIILAVLTYLRFAATGAIQLMVGDNLALSHPTISRLCKQVGEAISGLAGRFIQFPEVEEAAIVRQNLLLLFLFCILKLSNLHCTERLLISLNCRKGI